MLTILSFGAGQDSAALWNLYRYDKEFTVTVKHKHGHLTLDELREYRFSHGHCSTNSY